MSHTLQKIIIAYSFFIFGMMGGFAYLQGYEYVLNTIFEYNDYASWFLSALIALFFMALIQFKHFQKDE